MRIPGDVQYVLSKLETHGFEAYLVGGTVRDAVMGLVPHDFDITTSALPEVTERTKGKSLMGFILHRRNRGRKSVFPSLHMLKRVCPDARRVGGARVS